VRPSEQLTDPQAFEHLVLRLVWIVVAVLVAAVIGYWIGVQDIFKLAIFAGAAVFVAVATFMRDRAWVLIPFAWTLTGSSGFLPYSLSFRDVSILLAFCTFVTYAIVAQRSFRRKWHVLDVILAANVVWLVITFVHHPVGLRVFGGETIGARPYVEIFLALLAYRVIVSFPSSSKMVSRIPYFILAGTTIVALVNLMVYIAPSMTPIVYFFYRGTDVGGYIHLGVGEETAVTRWEQLGPFGMTAIFVLCGRFPPRTLFNPLRVRFYAFAVALVAILASGFRNYLLWAFVAIGLGSWLQRGWREVRMGAVAGALVLGALIVGQGRIYELPRNAQRAFSWLPGKWSPDVVANAEQSSESRFEWWRNVIKYDLIDDWWLGDGFGISASDYSLFRSSRDFIAWMTLVGGYHNGPLSSIRYTGVIGMILFYIFMIAAAVYSVMCVNRCRGTPLQMVAIFVAIQLIWEPFHYTLVFGGFDSQMPNTTFLVAVLLLVMRIADRAAPSKIIAVPQPLASAAMTAGTQA
jgi:O-Antigen ligase